MIKRITLQIILLTVISEFALGQQNVEGIYVDSLGQVYIQANMPAYFFLAPNGKKESRALITSKDPKSNPMYFDGNGIHYIKTLDAETNKMVSFKILADGIAPKISIHFKEGLYMNSPKKYIIEEGSKAEVIAKDNLSGVKSIYVSLDGSDFVNTNTILFGNGADYHVKVFAIDNVGNISDTLQFRALTSINSVVKLANIYYDTNSSRLRPESKNELNDLAQVLTEFPRIKIELRAHTDCRGDAAYNLILSEKRAEAVANYLIYKGINKNRLTSKGFGDTNPINECIKGITCSEEKHQENRRVEFKILPIK